jgi:4-oxalocrotonate tautomerase family enzyme
MKGGQIMPFINIKVLKGTLSKEKKDEMIKRVSETVAEMRQAQNLKIIF